MHVTCPTHLITDIVALTVSGEAPLYVISTFLHHLVLFPTFLVLKQLLEHSRNRSYSTHNTEVYLSYTGRKPCS
jgi:hypothetical protein